jgi:PIN domain nuclease of toxin-antitoxin system
VLLLLDTHAWIWVVDGDRGHVGPRARRLLSRAEAQDGVRISSASIFEVAALHTAGRLRLARALEQWIRDALAARGVRLAPVSMDMALDAGAIPRSALADPLDRLLVATARQLDATFLTHDARILRYAAETGNVRIHDASA